MGNLRLPTCGSGCTRCEKGSIPHYGKLCHDRFPVRCNFDNNGVQGWDCFADLYY